MPEIYFRLEICLPKRLRSNFRLGIRFKRLHALREDGRGWERWQGRCISLTLPPSQVVESSCVYQAPTEQSLKVVRICINTSNPNAQQTAAVASVVIQALRATYSQLPPLKWQRYVAMLRPCCPSCLSWCPRRAQSQVQSQAQAQEQAEPNPSPEPTRQHHHLTRDAANQLMLLGRWLSGCLVAVGCGKAQVVKGSGRGRGAFLFLL